MKNLSRAIFKLCNKHKQINQNLSNYNTNQIYTKYLHTYIGSINNLNYNNIHHINLTQCYKFCVPTTSNQDNPSIKSKKSPRVGKSMTYSSKKQTTTKSENGNVQQNIQTEEFLQHQTSQGNSLRTEISEKKTSTTRKIQRDNENTNVRHVETVQDTDERQTVTNIDHEEGTQDTHEFMRKTGREIKDTDILDNEGNVIESTREIKNKNISDNTNNDININKKLLRYLNNKETLDNIDIYSVGNPTNEEIERRKNNIISPNALIVHPDRLLPAILVEDGSDSSNWRWARKFSEWVRETFQKISKNDKVEQITDKVTKQVVTAAEQWETTQNPYLVRLRSIIDRLSVQTEQSRALEILQEDMSDFWVEDFLPHFSDNILPVVVKAWLQDDIDYLNRICVGEAKIYCKNMIDARMNQNILLSDKILWINSAELIDTTLSSQKTPQIEVKAEVQIVDCSYDRNNPDNITHGSESLIANNVFVFKLEPNLTDEYIKENNMEWQIRSFQTSKQRQLV